MRPLSFILLLPVLSGCLPNRPYGGKENEMVYHGTIPAAPKHLDPAVAYSSDEYDIICQIYEPLLQYHFLKTPAELVPLTVEKLPLQENTGKGKSYTFRIKKGIKYQDHPCFAKDEKGRFLYHSLAEKDLRGIESVFDFHRTATRELTSYDYANGIKRLFDPRLKSPCPIADLLKNYIAGAFEFSKILADEWKITGGKIDLTVYDISGVETPDENTLVIRLNSPYPQILYWLAMPFFSPVPDEAVRFYNQKPLIDRNITLDRYPVGTGPFRLALYKPEWKIALARNENYHEDLYPSEGEVSDIENGYLADAGRKLPLIDSAEFHLEKEAIPRWNKFLQGYFDVSGISSEVFDSVLKVSGGNNFELTEDMKKKGMSLNVTPLSSIFYFSFNMNDDTFGGYSLKAAKLRAAVAIALDIEEWISLFSDGRGLPAHSPLSPGIFGYSGASALSVNPAIYDIDRAGGIRRKNIEAAKKLLAEAGYPGGRDEKGNQLVLAFDNPWDGPSMVPHIRWLTRKLSLLGIRMENRTTDYNRFQDKMRSGNFQLTFWGWNADYPDPENFLFLLYGPNGKAKYHGENCANYSNPEYDRLFKKMETLKNSPVRKKIIEDMLKIYMRDVPWPAAYYPVQYSIYHKWYGNTKPNVIANNTLKYRKIDPKLRASMQKEWNRPRIFTLAVIVFIGLCIPAVLLFIRARRNWERKIA